MTDERDAAERMRAAVLSVLRAHYHNEEPGRYSTAAFQLMTVLNHVMIEAIEADIRNLDGDFIATDKPEKRK